MKVTGKRVVRKIVLASITLTCFTLFGCKGAAKSYAVDLVDRGAVFAIDKEPDPLRLVVEIDEAGKLRLNKIETGTTADLTEFSEKIRVIFEDRKMARIEHYEVVIDPQGDVQHGDLEKLIRCLAEANASPIQIIKRVPTRADM